MSEERERQIMRVDFVEDLVRLDPDVVIEGDAETGYRLTAPGSDEEIVTTPGERLIASLEGWWVDDAAIFADAQATGQREFTLSTYMDRL